MEDGEWKRAGELERFTIFHLPFSMQDAFFSILLRPALQFPNA
jgi:hypothetical protein